MNRDLLIKACVANMDASIAYVKDNREAFGLTPKQKINPAVVQNLVNSTKISDEALQGLATAIDYSEEAVKQSASTSEHVTLEGMPIENVETDTEEGEEIEVACYMPVVRKISAKTVRDRDGRKIRTRVLKLQSEDGKVRMQAYSKLLREIDDINDVIPVGTVVPVKADSVRQVTQRNRQGGIYTYLECAILESAFAPFVEARNLENDKELFTAGMSISAQKKLQNTTDEHQLEEYAKRFLKKK